MLHRGICQGEGCKVRDKNIVRLFVALVGVYVLAWVF